MTNLVNRTAVIANGEAVSAAVDIDGASVCGILLPASWTTANLTLQGSYDKSTYANVYDMDGVEITIVAAASRYIALNPADFLGIKSLKLRSGTSGTPVNQAAERSITVVVFAP